MDQYFSFSSGRVGKELNIKQLTIDKDYNLAVENAIKWVMDHDISKKKNIFKTDKQLLKMIGDKSDATDLSDDDDKIQQYLKINGNEHIKRFLKWFAHRVLRL